MQIIADSGSTKTSWSLAEQGIYLKKFSTAGINPYYQSEEEILNLITRDVIPQLGGIIPADIFFYGAGCALPEKKDMIYRPLHQFYPGAEINVESDLYAAARSLLQHEAGIACILGTGSNSCFYNGKDIVQNVSPLGYILGDEGSGAVLGKMFVADCLKNQIPEWIKDKFFDEYELTPSMVLEKVYKKVFPNRFLASFTPFIAGHIEEPAIFNLVFDAFDSFFKRNVCQYPVDQFGVSFTGSVAWYFRDTLEIVASENNIRIDKIVQHPLDGLISYHAI